MTTKFSVILVEGTDKATFLAEHSDCDCCAECSFIPTMCQMNLSDEEVDTLRALPEVATIEPVLDASVYAAPPVWQSQSSISGKEIRVKSAPSTSGTGVDYMSVTRLLQTNLESDEAGNSYPVGASPDDNGTSANEGTFQNFSGETVDIVSCEVGAIGSTVYPVETHPDFKDFSNNTRFVKMDWQDYDSNIISVDNQQITQNNTYVFSHPMGVLSACGGLINGWAKKSTLRVIYLSDDLGTCYNAVLAWHNSKPVNPTTGIRNATIIIGEHQWTFAAPTRFIPCDLINAINSYDDDDNLTITTRPGSTWGSDLTPFVNAGMLPFKICSNNAASQNIADADIWAIGRYSRSRYAAYDAAINGLNTSTGIYSFKAAGNQGWLGAGPGQPQYKNTVDYDAGNTYVFTTSGFNYTYSASSIAAFNGRRINQAWENGGENDITCGASQNSTVNMYADSYSNKGKAINIFGGGYQTWGAYPDLTYSDGFRWGYFSGTSAGTPNVVGVAAVVLDWWLSYYGSWPTIAELKSFMINEAGQPVIKETDGTVGISGPAFNWSNVPSLPATGIRNDKGVYTSIELHQIPNPFYIFGANDHYSLPQTTTTFSFLPWRIYRGNGHNISVGTQEPRYTERPSSGQAYPRRKIKR